MILHFLVWECLKSDEKDIIRTFARLCFGLWGFLKLLILFKQVDVFGKD